MGRCPAISLDPDLPLDDIVDGIKLCEAALGDRAMRGTVGLFKHCVCTEYRCIHSIRSQANGTASDRCYRFVTVSLSET